MDQSRVVMGVALGYGIDEFRRFVGSLRATGYTGSIILGASSDLSERCHKYLVHQHVVAHVIPENFLTPTSDMDHANAGFYSIAVPRWRLYEKWVLDTENISLQNGDGNQVENLYLLTDTRDVCTFSETRSKILSMMIMEVKGPTTYICSKSGLI